MIRRIRQLEEEKSSQTCKHRANSTESSHLIEGRSPKADGTIPVSDDLGGSPGNPLCSDQISWPDKQVLHSTAGHAWEHLTNRTRLLLAEACVHTEAKMCSTTEEPAGTENATPLGGTRTHLVDPRSWTSSREITGARETTTPLAQHEMRTLLHTNKDCEHFSNRCTKTDRTRTGETSATRIQRSSVIGTSANWNWKRFSLGVARSMRSVES